MVNSEELIGMTECLTL